MIALLEEFPRQWAGVVVFVGALAMLAGAAEAQVGSATKERGAIDPKYTWNVADLYPTIEDFEKAVAVLEENLEYFSRFQGNLAKSQETMHDCLVTRFMLVQAYSKLSAYAERVYHTDMSIPSGQALVDRMLKIGTRLDTVLSFVEPELLAIPEATLEEMAQPLRFNDFRSYLFNVTRRRPHIRNPEVESIVAQAGEMAAGPGKVYETLATVNIPYPELKLSTGEAVKLDQAGYVSLRYHPNREDRLKVFQLFWTTLTGFRDSLAGLLASKVAVDHFYAEAGKYKTDLESSLDRTDVPTGIYHNMIAQIRAGLPSLHRYLKLRKEILGLDQLGYHDLYVSISPTADWKFDYDQSFDTVLEALKVLGDDYVRALGAARSERWVDVYPTPNKRTGAYCAGEAYDVHPYVLLNHTDDYNSMSTAAHEFGHALHSYLANKSQPFPKARYPIFVAEVASTVNEILLRLAMSKKEKDKQKKLFLLGQALENYRTTVFRQALFAEFELLIHTMAQEGKPLTAEVLSQEYLRLLREYYGEDQGLVKIDPLYAIEWAFIPHFYYNFYMFQYTTSFIAATSIAETIFKGDRKARDNYLSMLKAGGSKRPEELLRMAGVDMSGPEPYRRSFKAMESIMDEIGRLRK
jgi:oligoendopeptidase F